MKPSEEEICSFVEVITGRQNISDSDLDITARPIGYGEQGTPNPSQQCRQQFPDSDFLIQDLQEAIISREAFQSDTDRKLKIGKHTAMSHKKVQRESTRRSRRKNAQTLRTLASKRNLNMVDINTIQTTRIVLQQRGVQRSNTFEIWVGY